MTTNKSIEIFYDIQSIPGVGSDELNVVALDFRNEAMNLVEAALLEAEMGEWIGAEIGIGEVNFGFEVLDFDEAEALVRKAVAGTPYENIDRIERSEYEAGDFDDELVEDCLDREAISESLLQLGFESHELLAQMARLCQRLLHPSEVEEENRVEGECSRLGGAPDVPPGFEWPRHDGWPLAFLAQVDYHEENLLLLFFYDMMNMPDGKSPSHRGAWSVMMFPKYELSPANFPDDLPDDCQYSPFSVSLVPDVNMPDYASRLLVEAGVPQQDIQRLEEMDREQSKTGGPAHHLLGYPSLIEGEMEMICQMASSGFNVNSADLLPDELSGRFSEEADEWTLLFQCDADPALGWTFGNSGRLFFWIKTADFAEFDFENVWVVLQKDLGN